MTAEKIILSRDTYETVKTMLQSPDEESQVLGLTCIENADFKINIAYILLLIHETNILPEMWKEHAPETTKIYKSVIGTDISDAATTYMRILSLMAQYEVDKLDYQFFMDRYAYQLTKIINMKIDDARLVLGAKKEMSIINSLSITVNLNT